MRVEHQPVYVLHQRPYRETSLIVEFLTQDYGRRALVVKGAKRKRSTSAGLLQPFVYNFASWVGKTNLGTLTEVECGKPQLPLSGDRLYCGFYLNELLIRLIKPNDHFDRLFQDYHEALTLLSSDFPVEAILRVFEKQLLQSLGYGLSLSTEIILGKTIKPEKSYQFVFEQGVMLLPEGEKAMGLPISGRALIALDNESFDSDLSLLECKRLMRHILDRYLGDKPLHSRALFRSILKK